MASGVKNSTLNDNIISKIECHATVELSECLKSSLKNILRLIMDDKFVSIYKACYKEFDKKDEINRPRLGGSSVEGKKYLNQFNDAVIKSLFNSIEETALSMNSKFKELEELKSSQANNCILWRPPGNAYDHILPFEFVSEFEKTKELEGRIEREREALNLIKSRLIQKRKKTKELNDKLLTLITDIRNLVTVKVNEEKVI